LHKTQNEETWKHNKVQAFTQYNQTYIEANL
jgi:hypothetical protein